MKINYRIMMLLVIFITSITALKAETRYVHTVDLTVKIVKVSGNTITYEYLGKEIKSKYSVAGYYNKDDTKTISLRSIKLNQEYFIQLEFPVNMRDKAMNNLGSGLITFIGIDVYPV